MAFDGLQRIDLRHGDEEQTLAWRKRCKRDAGMDAEATRVAAEIVDDVRKHGDEAVVRVTARVERRQIRALDFEVDPQRIRDAESALSPALRDALRLAADNILRFHRTQAVNTTELPQVQGTLRSRVAPLRRVAVYAPGGTAAYPSSVLMATIPAKVAGVPEVVLLTPRASDVVLAAANLAGVDRVFEIGGAQAIAAAAYGTNAVPRVDKIVGPGNAYVTAAKRLVYGACDIDGIAGPSEIVVAADGTATSAVIAADLISQAEHDALACAILITDHEPHLDGVNAELAVQLSDLPRREIAETALARQGAAVLVRDRAGMIAATNDYAGEHVELLVSGAPAMAEAITTAGAIFVGGHTPEAAGDYTAGPSHVLPTAGAARFASPLGVWDFVKYTSVLELSRQALHSQADAIVTLARAEGLEGHARAVMARLEPDGDG